MQFRSSARPLFGWGRRPSGSCPGPAWRDIRGIGNWLRHQYERIELPVIWKTVRDDRPPLKAAVLGALTD
jgi:uncharacterized protein with HEPN domain